MYLFEHKEIWNSEFEHEKDLIIANYAGGIEILHIGSTAINGLYAKDCIDLLGVVEDISEVSSLSQHFVNLGYVYKGEYGIAGREYFAKKHRKVHLHIFQTGNVNIEKHLNFVKVMQGNLVFIAELNQIKQDLHAKYPHDKDLYQQGKKLFYDRINALL